MSDRAFITIMHRNWHLVPYSQLVELLGWSQEPLAYTLLEDNFLFHKLGASKPDCEPVRHRPADDAVHHRGR